MNKQGVEDGRMWQRKGIKKVEEEVKEREREEREREGICREEGKWRKNHEKEESEEISRGGKRK